MQNKRCFLCGRKMAENGLCTNSECIRSTPVPGTAVAEALAAEKTVKMLKPLINKELTGVTEHRTVK